MTSFSIIKSSIVKTIGFLLLFSCLTCAWSQSEDFVEPTKIVKIKMQDGVEISAAIFIPEGGGKYPTLFAASPYRFDNNYAPAIPMYLWRETGPVAWYLKQGYAYVHMDVRGSGRSGGEYHFLDRKEQRDLYEVIEWIAKQSWSNGKIGGIGQSYYAMTQWFMATQNPPHLSCIAPYDGLIDLYRSSAFSGGIPGEFWHVWYSSIMRPIHQYPAHGPSRSLPWDLSHETRKHTTYDAFWKERAAAESLDKIKVPVYSIGLWTKADLHLNGNITGYQRTTSQKKLLVLGASTLYNAVADFSSIGFHEKFLLPYYDWCLKGKTSSYNAEPNVRYFVGGADEFKSSDVWPPKNIEYKPFFFRKAQTGSVTSLNDGGLDQSGPDEGSTLFEYPNAGWRVGVVGFGPDGRVDPSRRIMTFTSAPLQSDLEIAGPIKLVLYASSTNKDTDFVVKVYDQFPQSEEDRKKQINPNSRVITKGWLKASHREVDKSKSTEFNLWYTHTNPQAIEPNKVTKFEIAVMPTAYQFKKGNRIRIDLSNGDSGLTEYGFFQHEYTPNKLGKDTIMHNSEYPSQILLPIVK